MDRFEKRDIETRQRAASDQIGKLTEALVACSRSLIGAISIIEHTPECKKAIASDKMFDELLAGMKKNLEQARAALP
jgi:hypothetical protein